MADLEMTDEERDAFLADVHVGVLAIASSVWGVTLSRRRCCAGRDERR